MQKVFILLTVVMLLNLVDFGDSFRRRRAPRRSKKAFGMKDDQTLEQNVRDMLAELEQVEGNFEVVEREDSENVRREQEDMQEELLEELLEERHANW